MKKWARRILGIAAVLAVGALVVVSALPKPVPVDVARVDRGPLRVTVDEDARTRVKDRYGISAPLSGNLARLEIHPGDEVEAGQVLARVMPIDPPLLDARTRAQAEARLRAAQAGRAQVRATEDRARAALGFARREAERQRGLAQRNIVERRTLELAELDERTRASDLESTLFAARVAAYEVEVATAALGRLGARASTEQVEVTSPVKGRVLKVLHESGGVVQAGTPIVEVGDPSALEIVADLLTADAVQVRPGYPVEIAGWGGEGVLAGRVRLVEPAAFTRVSALGVEEQRVNAIVDLEDPASAGGKLGDGYRVEVRIVVWQSDDVLLAPASALFRHGGRWAAFVVEDSVARTRHVRLGHQSALEAEILGGLRQGDRVIVYPSDSVEEGTRTDVSRRSVSGR
ncbi:MAG: HlyD family efflux transporter periplasmic adaptor subunit [Deltaproteobacteria bacterium]|nr:HlyD family efflux transporter periplasmic adaptor subunit [Deltaproteobacteria bacterium]